MNSQAWSPITTSSDWEAARSSACSSWSATAKSTSPSTRISRHPGRALLSGSRRRMGGESYSAARALKMRQSDASAKLWALFGVPEPGYRPSAVSHSPTRPRRQCPKPHGKISGRFRVVARAVRRYAGPADRLVLSLHLPGACLVSGPARSRFSSKRRGLCPLRVRCEGRMTSAIPLRRRWLSRSRQTAHDHASGFQIGRPGETKEDDQSRGETNRIENDSPVRGANQWLGSENSHLRTGGCGSFCRALRRGGAACRVH